LYELIATLTSGADGLLSRLSASFGVCPVSTNRFHPTCRSTAEATVTTEGDGAKFPSNYEFGGSQSGNGGKRLFGYCGL
jgi:hypothetical protein